MRRNKSFHCLTRNIGKNKTALHKLIIKNRNKTRTSYDRKEIESLLAKNNREHLPKATITESCANKIKNLHKDCIRDKMLTREISEEDVDNKNIFNFLKLLNAGKNKIETKRFKSMTMED